MNSLIVPRSQFPDQFQPFESIKHTDQDGEHWFARELMPILGYAKWENFVKVIGKAKTACDNSGNDSNRHFLMSGRLIDAKLTTEREIEDFKLSRFACYLVAQNGDPRKKIIALAMTYFAMQTRKAELAQKEVDPLDILENMVARLRAQDNRLKALEAQVPELHEIQGNLAQDIEAINTRLDNAEYYTVRAYCELQGIKHTTALRQLWGKQAASMSRERGIQIRKQEVDGQRWDTENLYHQSVLVEVCGKLPRKPDQPELL